MLDLLAQTVVDRLQRKRAVARKLVDEIEERLEGLRRLLKDDSEAVARPEDEDQHDEQ